jgi:hypothetical protein
MNRLVHARFIFGNNRPYIGYVPVMKNQEITITIPIATEMDPLFVLTLNEHLAEVFRCVNKTIKESDIRIDVHTAVGLTSSTSQQI